MLTLKSPDVIAYLPVDYTTTRMSLCTGLAAYNQVKSSLRASAHLCWLGKNLQLTEGLECFRLYFSFQNIAKTRFYKV